MFKPFDVIKAIHNDAKLTHREKAFLTQAVLHTDNKSGKIKATMTAVARSAGINPGNINKLVEPPAVKEYILILESGPGVRTKWVWNETIVDMASDTGTHNADVTHNDEIMGSTHNSNPSTHNSKSRTHRSEDSTLLQSTQSTTTSEPENSKEDAPKVASRSSKEAKENSSSGSLLKEEVSKAKKDNTRNLFLGAEGLYNSLSLLLDSKEQYSSSLKFPLKELLEVHDSDYILLVAKHYLKVRKQHGGTCSIKHLLYKFDDYLDSYERVKADLEQRRKLKEMRSSWSTGVSA